MAIYFTISFLQLGSGLWVPGGFAVTAAPYTAAAIGTVPAVAAAVAAALTAAVVTASVTAGAAITARADQRQYDNHNDRNEPPIAFAFHR